MNKFTFEIDKEAANKPENEGVIYTPKFFNLPSEMTINERDLKKAFTNENNFRKFMKKNFGIILS